VIFDRHPYDARLADRPAGSSRLRRAILGHALPAPDAVVVLDAPAELLYARKPEHPLERVRAQRSAYLDLAARLPHALIVDVTGPLDDVARTVTAAVWSAAHGPRGGR
jgi:thymidylate kinase